jgi:hypothetical protein
MAGDVDRPARGVADEESTDTPRLVADPSQDRPAGSGRCGTGLVDVVDFKGHVHPKQCRVDGRRTRPRDDQLRGGDAGRGEQEHAVLIHRDSHPEEHSVELARPIRLIAAMTGMARRMSTAPVYPSEGLQAMQGG